MADLNKDSAGSVDTKAGDGNIAATGFREVESGGLSDFRASCYGPESSASALELGKGAQDSAKDAKNGLPSLDLCFGNADKNGEKQQSGKNEPAPVKENNYWKSDKKR